MKFPFRKTRTKELTLIEDFTDTIINDIEDPAFAVSQQNVMYTSVKELGGYFYLVTIIVGAFKIKTNKGAKLNIAGANFELELNADMDEFESDHTNVSNRFITQIDFQIEEDDILKIDKSLIKTLTLSAKKHQISFIIVED